MSPTAHAVTLTARRSARLVSWARAWRAGLVSFDEIVDVMTAVEEEQHVEGLPGTWREVELREALPHLAKLHPDEIRLVLPVPGDPRGLPGPGPFTDRALLAGELDIHEAAHAEEAAHTHSWTEYAGWAAAGIAALALLAWGGRRAINARSVRAGGAA